MAGLCRGILCALLVSLSACGSSTAPQDVNLRLGRYAYVFGTSTGTLTLSSVSVAAVQGTWSVPGYASAAVDLGGVLSTNADAHARYIGATRTSNSVVIAHLIVRNGDVVTCSATFGFGTASGGGGPCTLSYLGP